MELCGVTALLPAGAIPEHMTCLLAVEAFSLAHQLLSCVIVKLSTAGAVGSL